MPSTSKRVTICVCTYRRRQFLKSLLEDLRNQETAGIFEYSILVVDNDRQQSAWDVVRDAAPGFPVPIQYYVEPTQNISLARNKAVLQAEGDFIVFIDDDESPIRRWLLTLVEACIKFNVDGVLGPVHPRYPVPPPKWVLEGRFYDRPSYPTGFVIDWRKGRTGNTLLKRDVFTGMRVPFRPEFRTGEDQDFFRRVIANGRVFIWCEEAIAYETVPEGRWNRRFLLRRALLRGYTSLAHPTFGPTDIVMSGIATPAYLLFLPLALIMGQGRFMSTLVRLFDHLGRLLGLIGINPIKEPYVTS